MDMVAAVVVAAGRGERAGGGVSKQYRDIAGATAVRRVLNALVRHPEIDRVQPVVAAGDGDRFLMSSEGLRTLPPVMGGATRQASVHAGLEALAAYTPAIVLVHDAARPFASADLISRAIAAGKAMRAAVPALPVIDTVKSVTIDGRITATLDRTALRTIQTPQAFDFKSLLEAHRKAAATGRFDFSDDAALAEWAGLSVATFPGEAGNIKLTTAEDFLRAEAELMGRLGDLRIGSGYDVHAFGDGDHIMLGGVRVAHTRGLIGHSDGDVALHALVDALLGALAEGDIGVHFPPSDPRWKGASSDVFLRFAAGRVRARGGIIAHLDTTLVCESPRVGPHRDTMRARIAEITGITPDRIGVKATTSEKLGFTGRGEGIAAMATATVRLPLIRIGEGDA